MKQTNKVKKLYKKGKLANLAFYCGKKEKYTSVARCCSWCVYEFCCTQLSSVLKKEGENNV